MFRESIKIFPRFVKKVLYEYKSNVELDINKTQTNILMLVYEYTEKSMSEISLMTGLEKSSFTRSVDCLVKKGFITRNSPENDRRKIKLSLTDKGLKAAKLIRNDFNTYLDSLISDFSEKEKKEFFESLTTISGYINKILNGDKIKTAKNKNF